MKVKFFLFLAKLYNQSFLSQINLMVYLFAFSAVIVTFFFSNEQNMWIFVAYISVVILLLATTTVRLSSNTIYSLLTKHVSMNVLNYHDYHQYDYINERQKVAETFKEQFIQGFESAFHKGYKKIRMTTHSWMVKQVLSDPRVTTWYEIKIVEKGFCKIPLEVLLLTSPDTINEKPSEIADIAFRKRRRYKVLMTIRKED